MKDLISIIVPAYNVERYLSRCVDSILEQQYKWLEIIIVNDGSTDHTGEIIDEYVKKYPEKIRGIHTQNGGVTNARLKGIRLAKGEWIGFVDGDDELDEDMYRRLLENAHTYQADISHCGYRTIVNEGERVHYFYNSGKLMVQDRKQGLYELLSGKMVEPGLGNKLYKRKLFKELLGTDILDKSIRINEDLLMNYILFGKATKSVFEDFCGYQYMSRSNTATRAEYKVYRTSDPIKVRKWILDHAEPEEKDIAWRKYLVCCYNGYIEWYQRKIEPEKRKNLRCILLENKDKWCVMSRTEYWKATLILYVPTVYCLIYRLYEKYFQRKNYE